MVPESNAGEAPEDQPIREVRSLDCGGFTVRFEYERLFEHLWARYYPGRSLDGVTGIWVDRDGLWILMDEENDCVDNVPWSDPYTGIYWGRRLANPPDPPADL